MVLLCLSLLIPVNLLADLHKVQGVDDEGKAVNGEISTNLFVGEAQCFIFQGISGKQDIFFSARFMPSHKLDAYASNGRHFLLNVFNPIAGGGAGVKSGLLT